MRRYRNARYAPESLERKLSPSSASLAPVPAAFAPAPTFSTIGGTNGGFFAASDGVPPKPGDGPLDPLSPIVPTGPAGPA
jgi:hypothetical protein